MRRTYKESAETGKMINKILAVRKEFTGFSDVINRAVKAIFVEMGVEADYFAIIEQGHVSAEVEQ